MLINNYFVNSFLIITIINLLNFDTHDCKCTPLLFPCNYDFRCFNISLKQGSIYCCNIHLHHWCLGIIGLIILSFIPNNSGKSILEGGLLAIVLDGFLFSDRFSM
jgi:hypothetical protein